jgi:hypothetical protein
MVRNFAIRVDEDVYRELESRVQNFRDTPNLVLRRLLGLERPGDLRAADARVMYAPAPWRLGGFRRGRPRSQERRQTRQEEFRRPILETLAEMGGEGRAQDVLDEVGRRVQQTFTPLDREPMSNGEPRWRVSAAFERKNLVDGGMLDPRSPRGVWRITEAGRRWLEEQSEPAAPKGWDLKGGLRAIERVMLENKQWLQEMADR